MQFNKLLIVTGLVFAASAASATTITQFGDDVSFTYDDSTAYGVGTVVGNAIFFTPTTIYASSSDGAGTDEMHATLNIDVEATTDGFDMTMFSITEYGDYKLNDIGGSAYVDADGYFAAASNTTIACSGPCYDAIVYDAGTLGDTGGNLVAWDMGGTIYLGDTTGWGSDTSVNLTIQNNLYAYTTESGETAYIQKKFSITIPEVPVPAAVWLFGSGLLGLVAVGRRKLR